jgi:myosin heavy subunit
MLAFTVASHTVQAVSDLVMNSIEAVMGTTTLVSNAISSRDAARNKVSAQEKELDTARARLTAQEKRVSELEAKNTKLQTASLAARDRISAQEKELDTARARLTAQEKRVSELKVKNTKLQKTAFVEFDGKRMKSSEAVNSTIQSVQSRTKKVAATNVASTFGEGIPFYGIGIITAATAYEIWGACENMKELHRLQKAMNPARASDDLVTEVCGLEFELPTKQEIWDKVKGSPGAAWELSANALEGTSDWARELEAPDFSGLWQGIVRWFSDLM